MKRIVQAVHTVENLVGAAAWVAQDILRHRHAEH